MAKGPTEDERANWLDAHLPYELSMLRYSFQRLQAAAEPLDYNLHCVPTDYKFNTHYLSRNYRVFLGYVVAFNISYERKPAAYSAHFVLLTSREDSHAQTSPTR